MYSALVGGDFGGFPGADRDETVGIDRGELA